MDNRLSGLPNEVLLLILSFLTGKEIVRTSVVSKKWRRWLLGYYPKLNFEDSRTMEKLYFLLQNRGEELVKERSIFIGRVEDAMKQHLDSSIEQFRVVFDFDDSCQSHVDNWVAFALTKRVKNLELDFYRAFYREDEELHRCGLKPEFFKPLGFNHPLTSLSLTYVNITSDVVQGVLLSCPFLENLVIDGSESLTNIKSRASLSLKHLDVANCPQLQAIKISAPKLLGLRYIGNKPIELNIEDASSLSSVCINVPHGEGRAYAFESLSRYLPQLEVLSLYIRSLSNWEMDGESEHLTLPNLPLFTQLKVLNLCVMSSLRESLLGWAPLIEACPILEKLTLKFNHNYDNGTSIPIEKRDGSPLKRLKTLELLGYTGHSLLILNLLPLYSKMLWRSKR